MQPKKSLDAPASKPVDNDSTDTDPRPSRLSTTILARSSHTTRPSPPSSRSESRSRTPISCISRESISGEDCARHRFIVWAAVERNRSVHMAASERLRCPLLRCGERFDEHEEMLRHLTQCRHLSTGEYVCYECMKVERFNDKKCTCCSGQPTKRRRIINIAKHFFSNIGTTKDRRENSSSHTHGAESHPPSYDSLVDMHEQHNQAHMQTPAQREERDSECQNMESGQPQLELNGTELLELDSTPLLPTAELDAANYDAHSTAMLGPSSPCAERGEASLSQAPSLSMSRASCLPARLQLNTGVPSSERRRPSLALNTQIDNYRTKPQTTYLSPSSSLQSSSHGISPITPWSTSSKSSTIWSATCSQDSMLASPITPLSANTHPTAQQEDFVFSSEKDIDMLGCPEDPCHYVPGNIPELPRDNQFSSAIPRLLSDPLLFSYDPRDSFSWLSSIDTEISLSPSVNMMFTDPNAKAAIPPEFLGSQISSSAAKALVEQVWDALSEHFSNSVSKLSRLQNNPLADNLRVQTPRMIASVGLARFRRALNNNNHNYPARSEPLEYLCFIHLMYSISLVLHGDNIFATSNKLYEQAIAYSALFDAANRDYYYQIVTTIWQQNSRESPPQGRFGGSTSRPTGNKGKEPDYHTGTPAIANPDPLVVAGQNFLDELESIMLNSNIQQPIEVLNSEIWSSHLTSNQSNLQGPTPLTLASAFLVQDLCRRYHESDNLLAKLKAVGHNARAGYYSTIRKLELELVQIGKNYLPRNDFLDQYNLHVRELCDQVYAQHGNRPRVEYHLLGISLVDNLLRSIAREPQQPQEGHSEYSLMPPYTYEDDFFPDLNKTFVWNYPIIPGTPVSPGGVADFGPPLDIPGLQPVTSNARLGTGSPNPVPGRSDASETPSEYTVSPAPLSDALPEIPPSNSYRPTPPAQSSRGEGSEPPGPSTLSSSGPKVEASERCEICGYRPKGDPQWFKGSMAKHKKMQHSTNPPVIFKCPFPGCNSEYKNRRDNLRQHQIEKNHFVGDEASQRPLKRKRT
ncbi:hypothetical protein F5Y10DRAFT_2360 [Nemania abortiva]|nr:hypothetical protein F5Y10DRAFT_2360 [Nemania abortiva]